MCVCVNKEKSRRVGPISIAELTLPRLYQPCAAVLSMTMRIWAKVVILGVKRCTCTKRVAISRSLIVTHPLGLVSDKSLA